MPHHLEGTAVNEPARPRRRLRRTLVAVGGSLAFLVGGAYVATEVAEVPPPHVLVRTANLPPSQWESAFAHRTVEANQPRQLDTAEATLPAEVPWPDGDIALDEFLSRTHTNSFVVLKDGALVHEWYADGFDDTTRQPSFSVAKSMVSLLVGQAIDRGEITEATLLVDVVPELKSGTDYDLITVGHLLDMKAGVAVSEVYNQYWPFTGTSLMYLTEDLPEFVAERTTLDRAPGARGQYRSVETQLLGRVLEKVTGENLSTLLSRDVWTPMGAEAAARWSLDREGGHEKAFAAVNATARDYARLGQLVLDGGRAGGTQVIPETWVDRISTPAVQLGDMGYSAQWWHPFGDSDAISAMGIHGQYVFIDPASGTVVVKLSDHGDEQDETETLTALRAVATHVGAQANTDAP